MEKKINKKEKINPLAILSYLSVLCLIPLLVEKRDEFVKFHARQGFVLFICEVGTILISWIPFIAVIGFVGWILWVILSILGIINVINNKKSSLPLIGRFADSFAI
ncbi:MAG: hypothetical protein QW244_02015 [Candidatus Pacearchaeota archaeon]